jgi:hypothetical protein
MDDAVSRGDEHATAISPDDAGRFRDVRAGEMEGEETVDAVGEAVLLECVQRGSSGEASHGALRRGSRGGGVHGVGGAQRNDTDLHDSTSSLVVRLGKPDGQHPKPVGAA